MRLDNLWSEAEDKRLAELFAQGVDDEQLEALLDAAVRGGALRRVRTINQYAYTTT